MPDGEEAGLHDDRMSDGSIAPAAASALLADRDLLRILALLDGDGEEARLVGGALRNALLSRPVHEFDIATTAVPDVVTARARVAGLRSIPTGVTHGTVTIVVSGRSFEITTLREDVETDGRHAKVRFGRDFAVDAMRRDFTMNALSLTRDARLYDYVGGLDDIATRRLRFIGDPAQRIREDYLRILRFFRFSADYAEGPLDAAGLAASIRERAGLARVSRERIRIEILKLLGARRGAAITREICDAGLLGPLLASAPNPARLDRLSILHPAADPLLRLAALCVNVAEDAQRLRDCLRLSNEEHQRLVQAAGGLLPLHRRVAPPSYSTLRTLLFHHGRAAMLDAVILAEAEAAPCQANAWRAARAFLHDTPEPHLPFSGADLVARGIPSGRAIGEALKDLQARWIRAGFPQEPHMLAQLLDAVARDADKDNLPERG